MGKNLRINWNFWENFWNFLLITQWRTLDFTNFGPVSLKNYDFIYNFPVGGGSAYPPQKFPRGVNGPPSTGKDLYINLKIFRQTGQKLVKYNVFHWVINKKFQKFSQKFQFII